MCNFSLAASDRKAKQGSANSDRDAENSLADADADATPTPARHADADTRRTMNSVAELAAVGTSLFAAWRAERLHRNSLHADGDLHMRALAQQTEQHFQQLTAELLSAAKETDRDVWEQRNGQFQTLILAATLMFGVAMSAIIEGNFDAGAASPPARIAFATFVALALSSLFLCLIACVLVSRRMSYYMIGRAVSFVDRLGHILWTANHMIATTAEVAPLPPRTRTLPRRRRRAPPPAPAPSTGCGRAASRRRRRRCRARCRRRRSRRRRRRPRRSRRRARARALAR